MNFLSEKTERQRFFTLTFLTLLIFIIGVVCLLLGIIYKEFYLRTYSLGILFGCFFGGFIPQAILYPSIKKGE